MIQKENLWKLFIIVGFIMIYWAILNPHLRNNFLLFALISFIISILFSDDNSKEEKKSVNISKI